MTESNLPSTGSANPSTHQFGLYFAVTASWTIALFGYYAQAQLLDSIMQEFGVAETATGFLFSSEMLSYFLTVFCTAWPLARWSRVRTALIGCVIAIAANVASAYAPSFEMLIALRIVAGFGAGLVGASGTAAATSSLNPDRAFAIVTVGWGLVGGLEFIAIPYATAPYGTAGGYLLVAGVIVVLMPALVWLLPPRETEASDKGLFELIGSAPNRNLAIIALLGLLLYETGQSGIYTFIEQIGFRSGQDEFEVGRTLTGASYIGLLGGVLAIWLGNRVGRKWPIFIGLGLNAIAAAGLAVTDDGCLYIALNVLWNLAYYFVVPYLMGALAALDDLGRWAVAGDAFWNAGIVPGPVIAGALVEGYGYFPLSVMALVAGLGCMIMFLGVMTRLEASEAPQSLA
jgi:predicted MFS family arabinose efflux permease